MAFVYRSSLLSSILIGEIVRSFSTISGRVLRTSSTSASVVFLPIVKRIVPWTASSGRPIAERTCDGSRFFEWQAEPVEAAMPFSSRYRRRASPSMSRIRRLTLFGSLCVGWPFK